MQFFFCRIGPDPEPRERVIVVVAEDFLERLRSIIADRRRIIVGQYHDVCPAVVVSDCLECPGDTIPTPGNTHHRVVNLRIVQSWVTAELWKEWPVPVGHKVPGSYTHCTWQNIPTL